MFTNKINQLYKIIENNLHQEVNGKDIILLDVPLFINIGDTLIWEGTRQFLNSHNIRSLEEIPFDDFDFRKLPIDTVLLLSGGGDFGDLYPIYNSFRRKVVRAYPNNRIIVLPQSIHYNDIRELGKDILTFNSHNNLLIIGRDEISYDFILNNFKCETLLLPDMAFCINLSWINSLKKESLKFGLFLKRTDDELNKHYNYEEFVPSFCETHDWPTVENNQHLFPNIFLKFIYHLSFNKKSKFKMWYGINHFRLNRIKLGVQFVSQYSIIYTTRLHVAILCMLLGKQIVIFDNNYGKNSSFYNTWLKDLNGIKFIYLTKVR